MLFRLYPLRFSFVAREAIYFPPGKSSNILRGAFGVIFRRIACVPQCTGARECEWRASCPYARMFEPTATEAGPSGLADWPRPFVFRATHLDGRSVASGESFQFDLNLFDVHTPAITYLVLTFAQLAREGLGSRRSPVELTGVSQLGENGQASTAIFDGASFVLQDGAKPLELNLEARPETVSRLRVTFVTPTELKSGQQLAARPEFATLAARVRDRISTLRELYGEGALAIDFRGFGERAAQVRMIRSEIQQVEIMRRSTRTGQVHPIGGFIGKAEYEGDLAEFVPYLRAARWTGVGRQTVWGKGQIWVENL
ncbi:MAG: CRISPR system precrRNA processing endoribonuclease RAMP protein Cas6 [Acidobacteriaceae bacterium]|nr:CRISPR system precrRNA processing endoribonuclease RAMP protein Cas6 [Acidobacteriaceae bacterium]